ncbi:hypothetical protein [Kribbella sp. NPDC048928]|uniref:hypothetical protein n=1 Tax=Kribbella sp. NPDC048928 TaxID=3364111 RepID=UPI00371E6044
MTTAPPTAATEVLKLIQDQLAEERSTKTSLEGRAVAVITTSGTLTTLLFALSALVTKGSDYSLPWPARVLLILAVAAFLAAAVIAILAARPQAYREVTVDSLREAAAAENLALPASEAQPEIAGGLIDIIQRSRENNGTKADRLKAAIGAEVAGIVLVAAAVVTILIEA